MFLFYIAELISPEELCIVMSKVVYYQKACYKASAIVCES